LGLAFPCTAPEIKHAFRAKAKVMHPDSGGSNEAFQRLYQAYQEALKLVQ
jgi:curved DNA-binding protein CbpA